MSDIPASKPVRTGLHPQGSHAGLPQPQRSSPGAATPDAFAPVVTASSLNSRAGDLNALMDSMASGIKTLEQADHGLAAIIRTLEAMQTTLQQARLDNSPESRDRLAAQFNHFHGQLDAMADSAAFNGINLLRGDTLNIAFNETGTASIDIQTKDGAILDAAGLGLGASLTADDLADDDLIGTRVDALNTALAAVRNQSSAFGSNLSVVQSRADFTRNMITTLENGAAKLSLADQSEEAANLLALQTRQALSGTGLSMASMADQSVLQLLR